MMGRVLRNRMVQLRLAIVLMAMAGMEADVLCNPFSPLQILRWLQPLDGDDADAGGAARPTAIAGADEATSREEAPRDAGRSGPGKKRARLDKPAEMHDLIAVRSKVRTPVRSLATWIGKPAIPLESASRRTVAEFDHPVSGRVAIVHRLCRLLC